MTPAIFLAGVAVCAVQAAQAQDGVFAQVAHEKAVSSRLLYAIALAESGRGGAPWPWTLNVEGRSLYFADRQAAHTALVGFLRRGFRSIDVGYMQVNLLHNGARFADTWAALDPHRNVSVAADILRENYLEASDVSRAVAHYHSRTPWRADQYLRRVAAHYRSSPRGRS